MAIDESPSPTPLTIDPDAIAPTDGSAAELNEDATCIVAGCAEDPVTHRSMKVSLPVYGPGSAGQNEVVNRIEQTVQAALCATHAEMLVEVEGEVEKGPALRIVGIDETTGTIE